MSLLSRFRTPAIRLSADPEPEPAVHLQVELQHLRDRTYVAEDAARAMSTRLDAALARGRADRDARDEAEARCTQLVNQNRDLGHEVVALRALLVRAREPRGTDRRCTACQTPMQFGMAHYCPRTSTYTEEVAAA